MSSFKCGIFDWIYSGGSFPCAFRPSGVFYCEKFPAQASWSIDTSSSLLIVDWKKYGKYAFDVPVEASSEFRGSVVGDVSKWRTLKFLRSFSPLETAVLGEQGFGSVWDFIWEKGSFEVEFRCDGYNHFVCNSFPAHSHWTIVDDTVKISWAQYGEYELKLSADGLAGSKVGQPSNWRRATFLRSVTAAALASTPAHDHGHAHEHDDKCGH